MMGEYMASKPDALTRIFAISHGRLVSLVEENTSDRMPEYKRNKIKTAWHIFRLIENWPTAFEMRTRQNRQGLRVLNFRNGLNIICRGGTQDWNVIHELLFAESYRCAMNFLRDLPGKPIVLDLGGNIGLFSMLATLNHPAAEVYAYEPGPPNFRIFEMNCLANPQLAERIHLRKEAVAGRTRQTEWFFDSENPGASGLFATQGQKFTVQIRAFTEVLDSISGPIALAKIDIEGAEYELAAETPPTFWQRFEAVSLELHDDPEKKTSKAHFLERIKSYGFKIRKEAVCSLFAHR